MKNIILFFTFITILGTALAIPIQSQAVTIKDIQSSAQAVTTNTGIRQDTDLGKALGSIINALFVVIGSIFLAIVFAGGFMWMTAGGNEEKVGKAKAFIFGGINGMIIIFMSYALIYVVLAALQASLQAPAAN